MMMIKIQADSIFTLIGYVFLLLVLLYSTSIKAQEVEDEREYDYIKGSELGPERWGDLRPEWMTCKNGTMQSPINLSNQKVELVPTSKRIHRSYKPQNATINNRGHDIMLQWEGDAGFIVINGTQFNLQQAHWHSPSEHTINGKRYAMELHMLHRSIDANLNERIAVISVLYTIGSPDRFLSRMTNEISTFIDQGDERRQVGVINPIETQISGRRYYKYIGSLTTPPCTEGVVWTINKDQVKLLRDAVHDYAENNARPLQQQNHREVHLYGPETIRD